MKVAFPNRTSRTWIPTATFQNPEVGYRPPTSGSRVLTSNFQHLRVGSWELGNQLPIVDHRKLVFKFHLLTVRHFDFATKITKDTCRKQQRSRLQTSLVGSAGPHGSSRAPTGFHGRFFQAVFRLENYRFSAFLDTFLRGKSIGAASHIRILLVAIGKRMKRKGEEVGITKKKIELEHTAEDFRGLVFRIGPKL